MGSFVSKPATCSEEVVVKQAIRADNVSVSGELNHSSKTASFDPSASSSSRSDLSQPSQAPRQTHQAANASLHVNSRNLTSELQLNGEWDRALGAASDVALAEEEEMQRAIEASLQEGTAEVRQPVMADFRSVVGEAETAGAVAGTADASSLVSTGALADALKSRNHLDEGSKRKDDVGKASASHQASRSTSRTRQPENQFKAGLGLGNDYVWVDNSDFRSPPARVNGARRDSASNRSASCGSRPAGNMRSGIVSLPRITQQLPVEQQVMVKEMHEKIKGTMSPQEEAVRSSALGKNASAPVLRVMEDLSIDDPLCRGSRQLGHGGDRDTTSHRLDSERFNENFHSCRAGDMESSRSGGCTAAYPSNGVRKAAGYVSAGSAAQSSGVRRVRGPESAYSAFSLG